MNHILLDWRKGIVYNFLSYLSKLFLKIKANLIIYQFIYKFF